MRLNTKLNLKVFFICGSYIRNIFQLGLKNIYESNNELVFESNMIPALSFVPESKTQIVLDVVTEDSCSVANKETDISQSDDKKEDKLMAFFQ